MKYIKQSKDKLFITKHILTECKYVTQMKIKIFKRIVTDIILFLDDNQDIIFNEKMFTSKFLQLNNKYIYKDKIMAYSEINMILHKIWIYYSTENIDGFTLLKKLYQLNMDIDSIVARHKNQLYNKFILIDNHANEYTEINNLLLQNNSHKEDNEIILDLYEYHLIHKIQFILVTFDKNFYNAIQKSNLKFITQVYNLEDIKQITINNCWIYSLSKETFELEDTS